MLEDYKSALRAGQRAYRARIARGQSPYLAVLDDVLKGVDIVAQEPLGLVEIPSDSLVGTKTSGRHTAFSYDFMPCWSRIPSLLPSGRTCVTRTWKRASILPSSPLST